MAIRILSVLSHLTHPRDDCGDVAYDFDRFNSGFQPVPGGNLCTLLWLGYRYVHSFAIALRELDARLAHASTKDEFDELARGVLKNAALVPGHHMARARNPDLSDDDLTLWPDMSLTNAVARAKAHLERAVRQARRTTFTESRTRLYPIRSPKVRHIAPSPHHLTASQIRVRNYRSYIDGATDILESLVSLLRLSAHVAVQLQRFLDPNDATLGLEPGMVPPVDLQTRLKCWRGVAAPVDPLAHLNPNLLDTHFQHSWRDTTVPLGVVQQAEYRLAHRVNHDGWRATALAWGVLPGDVEAPNFAGRCKRIAAKYIPSSTYRKHPPPYHLTEFDDSDLPIDDRKSPIAARLRQMIVERQDLRVSGNLG